MKKSLTLLAASTALTAAIGVFAWSAMHDPRGGSPRPFAAIFDEGAQAQPVILASDDDDDRHREGARRDHEDDGDDCDDDDDDDECRGGGRDPAPTGSVAPPQNGLFGNGAPPQVQVN